MGGVDHNDQLRGYYHVRLKCRKYYKYIFWFLFDVAVINSYILAKHYTDLSIKDVKAFRTELAKGLIGEYSSRKRSGRPTLNPAKRFCAAHFHFPVRGSAKFHRCHFCHTYKHQRHETVWYCMIGFCATMAERMTASFLTHTMSHPLLTVSFIPLFVYNTTHYYQHILPLSFSFVPYFTPGVISARSHRSTRDQIDYMWPSFCLK